MFLWPSKPNLIYNPDSIIENWKKLGILKNFKFQLKKNGSRTIPETTDSGVTMWDRKHTTLTPSTESDWNPIKEIFGSNSLLDGELIGRKQGEISNRLYLWDLPIYSKISLIKYSYEERYATLIGVFKDYASRNSIHILEDPSQIYIHIKKITIGVAKSFDPETWKDFVKGIKYDGSTGENEGLVFKDFTHNLSWDLAKTREIKEQLKFLLKYAEKI
jgi:hypothetical protein